MGIDIYYLENGAARQILIGNATHHVGVVTRLWKVTETGDRQGRIDAIESLSDAQETRIVSTPRAVMVDALCEFGESGEFRAYLILGWDAGRLKTQDFDWDHLPTIGWSVETPSGALVLHERVGDGLVPMSEERALAMGIIGPDGRMSERRLPVIAECVSVEGIFGGFYIAECVLADGRAARISGESESRELPDVGWFAGRDTGAARRYSLVDQLARKQAPD